jgi:hypothetical protein
MIYVSNELTFSATAWEFYIGKYWLITAELVPKTLIFFPWPFLCFSFGRGDFNVHVNTNYHPQFNFY